MIKVLIILILFSSCASTKKYPKHWWKEVPKSELAWWEISPHTAKSGEVVLSKRNELGILSNFSHAPFNFEGKRYPNVEALWQSMKYPEKTDDDPRNKIKDWPKTRAQVEKLTGFAAKKAGDFATKAMKELDIDWVSFNGQRFAYRTEDKGTHYKIIRAAMYEKLLQNPKVKEILLNTGNLKLLPDHHTKPTDPPAWKYFDIWMDIRQELQEHQKEQQELYLRDWDASRRM